MAFDTLTTDTIYNKIKKIEQKAKQIKNNEHAKSYCDFSKALLDLIDEIKDRYQFISSKINSIILYKEKQMRGEYRIDELLKLLKDDKETVSKMFEIAQLEANDLIEYQKADSAKKHDKLEEIQKKLASKIDRKFSGIYNQEDVEIQIYIDNNVVSFNIYSDGKRIPFNERSEGFKWYFCLFIELYYYENINENILILMDEPASNIHINAKKEILGIFDNVVSGGNQIVYSTHSPFMINMKNLGTVQLVEKENGRTTINRNFYTSKQNNSTGSNETLSPIINAIGFDLRHSFEINHNRINIILEGITDYYYLDAMWEYLELPEDSKPYFLPCVGVSHVNQIATILTGWGVKFKALLDLDNAGRNEYKVLEKLIVTDFDKRVYFNHNCTCDSTHCECNQQIENLLSAKNYSDLTATNKVLKAKEFHTKLYEEDSGFVVDTTTKKNFKNLFDRMDVI